MKRWITVAAAAAALLAPASGRAAGTVVTGMTLTRVPSPATGITALFNEGKLIEDPALLNAFASEYANSPHEGDFGQLVTGVPSDSVDFFNYWLANRLYNIVQGVEPMPKGVHLDLSTDAGLARFMWLDYVAGYYSGLWERITFDYFTLPRFTRFLPENTAIAEAYNRYAATAANLANHGNDDQVLAYNLASLRPWSRGLDLAFDQPLDTAIDKVLPWNDDLAMFGFDAEYALNVSPGHLDSPRGATAPVTPFFHYDKNRLLDATYGGVPEQPYLTAARAGYASITSAEARARLQQAIAGQSGQQSLPAEQSFWATLLGDGLYTIGIPGFSDYTDFDNEQYDNLLAWDDMGVMENQSAAFDALTAYANQDVALGRRTLRMHAMWWLWTYMYTVGGQDPWVDDLRLPHGVMSFAQAFPKFDLGPATTRKVRKHRAHRKSSVRKHHAHRRTARHARKRGTSR